MTYSADNCWCPYTWQIQLIVIKLVNSSSIFDNGQQLLRSLFFNVFIDNYFLFHLGDDQKELLLVKDSKDCQLLSSLSSLFPVVFVLYCEVQLFSPLTFEAAAFNVTSTQIMKDHGWKIVMAQLVQETSKWKLKYIYNDCRRKRYNLPVRERPEEGFRHCRTKLAQPMDEEISAWYVGHVGHLGHCRTLKNIVGHKRTL